MCQTSSQKRKIVVMSSCWNKFSSVRSIRIMAFMDLIDAIIFTIYRAILLTHLLAKIPPSNKADRREVTGKAFYTSGIPRNENVRATVVSTGAREDHTFNGGSYHLTGSNGDEEHMRYWSVLLLTGIVVTFAIEVFLFLLLNSGAPMRNLRHCKHWLFLRVLLFLCSIAGLLMELSLGEYTFISGFLEIEKLYRVATFLVMLKFMEEVKAGHFDNRKLNCNLGATDAGGSSNVYGSYSQAP